MADSGCHQFQLVLEAEFVGQVTPAAGGSQISAAALLKPGELYSLDPTAQRKLSSYTIPDDLSSGHLWEGNFEKAYGGLPSGKMLAKNCKVKIVKATVPLFPLKAANGDKAFGYVWGTPEHAFFANRLDVDPLTPAKSDVNQIVSIKPVGGGTFPANLLQGGAGIKVQIVSDPAKRVLKTGDILTLLSTLDGHQLQAQVVKSIVNAAPPFYY